jgi:ribosomal-protein-alanine N-acetyltransferase
VKFEIAPAKPSDIAALAEIETRCPHAAGWGFAGLKAELEKPAALLLAAKTGEAAAGFICANIIPPEAQILNLAVAPEHFRRGAATALLEAVSKTALSLGCAAVTLEADETNSPAIALYAKLGFRVVGRRAKFYNGRNDALLLDLKLPPSGKQP